VDTSGSSRCLALAQALEGHEVITATAVIKADLKGEFAAEIGALFD
jgi:hypothetical protein